MSDSIRENLLNSQSSKYEILEYPELGIKVKVKGISYGRRTELLRDCALGEDRVDMVKLVPRAIIETFHDPLNDKPIFTAADNDTITSLSPETIEKARDVIWRVIGLVPETIEKKSGKTKASGPSSVSR